MRQNGASDDRQIRVGASEIMRENIQKCREVHEGLMRNPHGDVVAVQYDAVLIVVGVRRILQKPFIPVELQRNQAVCLARGMIAASCIAFIFAAEQALRIDCRRRELRLCDITRILFRLGKIDGNIERTIRRLRFPGDIAVDARLADIIGGNAEPVIGIRRGLRRPGISIAEASYDLGGTRHHAVHQPRIEKITLIDSILDAIFLYSIIEQSCENRIGRRECFLDVCRYERLHAEAVQQTIGCVIAILRRHKPLLFSKMQQTIDFVIDIHDHALISYSLPDGSDAISRP